MTQFLIIIVEYNLNLSAKKLLDRNQTQDFFLNTIY